jgi:CubicO group peptidase (beta-lactamase class C family)
MALKPVCATLLCIALPAIAFCAENKSEALGPAQTAAIDRYVVAEMARERIPGVEIGIYRNGHAVLEKGYGLANVELHVPVDATTRMQSASVGKQFVATAVMMLVEQGKVGLDDSIVKYFPDAPSSWRAIKVKNLLSHTSGLAEYETHELIRPGAPFDVRMDFSEDELVSKIEALPIEFGPGDKWAYRNTNYVLLGVLIHRVTGKPYGDYLHEKVFAPLGMDATRIISDRDIIPGRSSGYAIDGGQLKNQKYVSETFNSTADGSLYFNVVDLEKWDRALYGTSLLSKTSLYRMWTPVVLNEGKQSDTGYGFGWSIGDVNGHRVVEHGGISQGFSCTISRYVDDRLTVVVLTNLDGGHAEPSYIERVVAGLVNPALMPKLATPIKDTQPEIAAHVRTTLEAMLAGRDVSNDFTADAAYVLAPTYIEEVRGALPANWQDGALVLIKREDSAGMRASVFRVGPAGDTRVVGVGTDGSGKLKGLVVRVDPDNR